MSRKYVKNGGNRRSTNGQPGQWSPLFATAATPGIGGGQTVMQIFASQYGCSVNPLVPDALECYLVATVAGNVVELQASALTAEGDDGEGTLARLVFDAEIDPSYPWYLRIPAGWNAMRARDGSPVAGLLCPSGLVPTPPQGSIGVSNMLDVVPPSSNPALWVPQSLSVVSGTSVQFSTGGAPVSSSGPDASVFAINGIAADTVTPISGSDYQLSSASWAIGSGEVVVFSAPAYSPSWVLTDGTQLGLVLNGVQAPA